MQNLEWKTRLKLHKNRGNYYDQKNYKRPSNTFMFEEDPFSKGAQVIALIMHEAFVIDEISTQETSN